ncbi:MAG: TIGR00266 family protein [Firmicutes bacterium]|nr:TIGR00266 family protein [Bacillota bacterium]
MADNIIEYQIYGDDMQLVEIELDPGEGIRAEAGAMTYMTQGIEMETTASGGFMGGLKRALTGESFFITSFTNKGRGKQQLGFGAPYPGKIIPLDLAELGGTFMCQKDSYLCSAMGVNVEIAFTKRIGAGLFGGEGFILQKLVGKGLAFVHAGGTIIKKELAPGERLRVDTGCLVAFAPSVDYDIAMVGGFKNMLFGGEGLFLATMTGPGLVYLQSLPLSRLADRIISSTRAGGKKGEMSGISSVTNIGGGLLGSIFGDD